MFMGIRILSKNELESFLEELRIIEEDFESSPDQIYSKKCEIE